MTDDDWDGEAYCADCDAPATQLRLVVTLVDIDLDVYEPVCDVHALEDGPPADTPYR